MLEMKKMNNNTLNEIGKKLLSAHKIGIFPHVNADGDALGSSTALCIALKKVGKEAVVFAGEEPADNLKFMDEGFVNTNDSCMDGVDISICVDCGDVKRLTNRAEVFLNTPFTICIDHHVSGTYFCDMNHIDNKAPATGHLIYNLIKTMNVEMDKEIGNRIYAAIATDTGNFQYENTNKESHDIISSLYDVGIEPSKVATEIYESNPLSALKIQAKAIDNMEVLCNGKVAFSYVSEEMLNSVGAKMSETESIVPKLRSIGGVELAVLLKEYGKEEIKVSLRSKNYVDVAKIAGEFGGGGHVRASGFTMNMTLNEAVEKLKEYIERGTYFNE